MSEKKTGYLSVTHSKHYKYVVLRKSVRMCGEDGKKRVKKKQLYSFGSIYKALDKMEYWLENPSEFPQELTALGYDLLDINQWIFELNEKVSKYKTAE